MIAAATLFDPRPLPATPPSPLCVVHVVLSLDVGGLERVVLSLAKQGRELGHAVTILCIEKPGALAEHVQSIGADLVCVDKGPGLRLGTSARIARIFKRIKPDVVHTHQIGALLYAGKAARRAGVPAVVHTEHGKHYDRRWRTRMLGRVAAKSTDRYFCVSKDIAESVEKFHIAKLAKLAVIANGIDLDGFEGVPNRYQLRAQLGIDVNAPVVGTVGRLSQVKRQDLLIKAFAEFRGQTPDAHLLLVGDGPMLVSLQSQVRALGIERVVHFAGYQSRPQAFLQAMDLFVLTSESEGMPLAVLEAWAARLPVVASHVGGLPELIDDGRTGLLFPFGDTPALVMAMSRVLRNRQIANGLGAAGRRRVENEFTLERTTRLYDAEYRTLVEKGALATRR